MDTAQWSKEAGAGVVKPMEEPETAPSSCSSKGMTMIMMEKKVRPQRDEALNCPRCNSTNTKFCYYNNYSLTQPRYFCKTCRRYWTEGGSLRNVPVGGGSRKNKRILSISSSSSHKLPQDDDLNPPTLISNFHQNPKTHQGPDLNLANFPAGMQDYLSISQYVEKPKFEIKNSNHHDQYHSSPVSALELLRTSCRGFNSFAPTPMPNSGFLLQELKPNLSFPHVDHHQGLIGGRYGNLHALVPENGTAGSGSRLMFPFGFGALNKQVASTNNQQVDHRHTNKGSQENSTSSWNGMFGGGSW